MAQRGHLRKMAVALADPVQYTLRLVGQEGETGVLLNPFIGRSIHLRHTGNINCVACGRKVKKSFQQGYCFPCMRSLPECDGCIVKPETCHFEAGTCRDEQWAQGHCFQPHYVYLANSSGIKVGITRGTQVPTRWIDQGATQALPIFKVQTRLQSGLVEVALKQHISDRTDWRKMLKGAADCIDMAARRDELLACCAEEVSALQQRFEGAIEPLTDEAVVDIHFPVTAYPTKVKSFNFDKDPDVKGVLHGIKGQYLILDGGVINLRKFGGYEVEWRSD